MLTTIRLILEVLGVAAIVLSALWIRDDSSWEPKITFLVGLIAYGQSLLGRARPPSKKEIKAEFQGTVNTYRSQWAAEKRLQPADLRTAKNIAKNIQWSVGDFSAKLGSRFPAAEASSLEDIIHDLRSIEEHQLSMDGGASYRAFWKAGDDSFVKIDSFLGRL